jgi:hypothetical protein
MKHSARNNTQPEPLHFVSRGNGGLHADFTKTTFTEIKPTQSVKTAVPTRSVGTSENEWKEEIK